MKLAPTTTRAEIEALLRSQSELVYGTERTQAIAGSIEHLATMLEAIVQRELDLTDSPPDTRGIPERRNI